MYLLINKDNSVNYGNDHPVDPNLEVEGLTLIEFPDKTLAEVVKDISPREAHWDPETQTVIRDPNIAVSEEYTERAWRNKEIQSIVSKIDQYERDERIPQEFRTSKISDFEYIELLRYRKSLCDYPETNNCKLQIRPQLIK